MCLPENYAAYFFIDTYNTLPDTFVVAESQGHVVGYIMCRLEHGFSDLKKLRFAKKGHIISVAVIPDFRRLGIGYSLVEQALSALSAVNSDECYLEVRMNNEAGIELYKKMGFIITRTIQRRHDQSAHLEPHTQRFRRLKRATGDNIESINSRGTISNSGIVVDPPTVIM